MEVPSPAADSLYVHVMTDDQPIRHIYINEPIPGLEEQFERDRERYVLSAAEEILGDAGRMIAGSKSGYCRAFPDHLPIFNANVCVEPARKIWFGDLDLTLDEAKLLALARMLRQKIYVLYEHDARFADRDDAPLLGRAAYAVTPDGVATVPRHASRADDGRLRLTSADRQ